MKRLTFAASLFLSSLLAYQGSAQYVQFWDNNGTSTPTSGNWDTTSSLWATNVLTASTVPFTNSNFAVFAAGSTTISSLNINVPGAITCEGIGNGTAWDSPSGAQDGSYVTTLNFTGTGSINLPAGEWSFECGGGSETMVVNVPITGAGGIIQHNSGSLNLYGNNTYSGGTTTTGGQIVNYNNNNSFGTGPITNGVPSLGDTGNAIFLCTNASSDIVTIANPFYVNLGGFYILDFGDGNTTLSGPMYLNASVQLKNNGTSAGLTISGAISGASGAGILFETPNTGASITLSGANTYTGQSSLTNNSGSGGSVVIVSSINSVSTPTQQASSSLGVPSSVANGTIPMGLGTDAAKLTYTGPGETSDRVISLFGTTGGATIEMDGAGPLVLTANMTAPGAGKKTLTLQGTSTATNTISGVIPNNSGGNTTALTKAQAGTWVLNGLNTFSGPLTISGGTLTIGGSGYLAGGTFTNTISDTATFVFDSSAAQTLTGVISGSGSLQQNGSGNLTLSGTNTYTGATTVGSSSTLIVSGTGKLANNTPITLNGALNITSTVGQNVDLVAGSGLFNQNTATATLTLTNLNDAFSGLFTVTSGTLAINADGGLGTAPGSYLADDITLNGGPAANLRANANNITINANRGIALGVNGGAIQVAGSDTCTYNGVISGSGQFQAGVNATVGLGVLVLGGVETYTNTTVIAAGTLRLAPTASLGNSAGIVMSNTPTLDVSAENPFELSTTNTFTAIGTTDAAPPVIFGAAGGDVNFGSQPVYLSFVPAYTNGDPDHTALTVSQGTLQLSGNTIYVTNASTLPLAVGNYALIQSSNGISLTSPTLNYVGPIVPNTTTSLVVIGNTLELRIAPAAGYTGTVFSNLSPSPSQTAVYGTSTATFSGTVSAAGPAYPAMNETVSVAIGTVATNIATITDNTGDFTVTAPINTVPAGNYVITYTYPGTNSTLAPSIDTSTELTITKAAVTVTANAQTKTYGQTNATGAGSTLFTATGLQNSDTIGSVTLAISGSPSGAVSNAPVSGSPYTITPSAATGGTFNAANYSLTYATGTLTVNPLPVGLTGTRPDDGTATAIYSILSITNIVGTDVVTVASGSVTLASPVPGVEPIISASALILGGGEAGNYTTAGATGAVTVTANTNPTNIGFSIMNNQMTLSWPADHTGWELQAQTNSLSVGIGTNWVDVIGSTTNDQIVIPVDVNNGNVYYRLVYPPQ